MYTASKRRIKKKKKSFLTKQKQNNNKYWGGGGGGDTIRERIASVYDIPCSVSEENKWTEINRDTG